MLISRTQQRDLQEMLDLHPNSNMLRWVKQNTHSILQTWEALEEMDDQTFESFLAMVNVIAEQRNQSE